MNTLKQKLDQGHNGWIVALGILLLLAGIGAIAFPLVTTLSVEFLIGGLMLVAGFCTIIHAFSAKEWTGFFWQLLLGVIYAIAGVFFLVNPIGGVIALNFALGTLFMTEGIMRSILAFQIRPEQNWGWVLVSGCISGLLGVLILSGMINGSSLVLIGVLVGVNFISVGASFIALGAGYKSHLPAQVA